MIIHFLSSMSTQKVPLKLQNYLIAPPNPRECSQDLNSPLCCATYYHFKVKFLLVSRFNWYRLHTFWNAGKSEGKAWLAMVLRSGPLKVVFQKIMKTLLIKVNCQKESGFKRYIFLTLICLLLCIKPIKWFMQRLIGNEKHKWFWAFWKCL